jgi:hypothetical protein
LCVVFAYTVAFWHILPGDLVMEGTNPGAVERYPRYFETILFAVNSMMKLHTLCYFLYVSVLELRPSYIGLWITAILSASFLRYKQEIYPQTYLLITPAPKNLRLSILSGFVSASFVVSHGSLKCVCWERAKDMGHRVVLDMRTSNTFPPHLDYRHYLERSIFQDRGWVGC